jgi:hypothetical protein
MHLDFLSVPKVIDNDEIPFHPSDQSDMGQILHFDIDHGFTGL